MARWITLVAVLGALAAGASASGAASARAARVNCGPAAGRTLAHGARARVYALGSWIYGCARGGGRPVRLSRAGPCPGSAQLGPFALAGAVAAYASRTCGVDTATSQVVVRRLSGGGALLSSNPALDTSSGVESFESVGSIVVRSDGAVAWIGSSSSVATHQSITEVLAYSGGALRRLDQGPSIRDASLALHGSILTWEDGAARQSAPLG
jgi:hypothetical protein